MRFGPRKPSFKKMLAARASPKRWIRHSLGIKAPRGWGWLTNPKKAAYNRVYSRSTFSLFNFFKALFGVPTKKRSSAASRKPKSVRVDPTGQAPESTVSFNVEGAHIEVRSERSFTSTTTTTSVRKKV